MQYVPVPGCLSEREWLTNIFQLLLLTLHVPNMLMILTRELVNLRCPSVGFRLQVVGQHLTEDRVLRVGIGFCRRTPCCSQDFDGILHNCSGDVDGWRDRAARASSVEKGQRCLA